MLAYKLQKANLCKVNYRNEGKTINTQEWCTTTGTGGPGLLGTCVNWNPVTTFESPLAAFRV